MVGSQQYTAHQLSDISYLSQALSLAKLGRGFCSPNPAVGAVLIGSQGDLITVGYHSGPGSPHAEVNALARHAHAKDGTMYVTLEPCCHWGRTPPCTDALIQSGIKRIIYGYTDPNPMVAGSGAAILQAAGIACEHLSLPEINDFYRSYHHWHATKKPFVTAKIAMTINGVIAGKEGERIAITDSAINEFTHYSRKISDAILTTAKTIIHDDPAFNARYQDEIIAKPIYILDSELRLSNQFKVWDTAKNITIFYNELQQKLPSISKARFIPIEKTDQGLNLEQILQVIGQDGIHDLWVEAGGKCFAAFHQKKLVQRSLIYIAPRWFEQGQLAFPSGISLQDAVTVKWQQYGNDIMGDFRW